MCVKEQQPDRQSMALDSGAFLQNFKQCAACGVRGDLLVAERKDEEDGDGMCLFPLDLPVSTP